MGPTLVMGQGSGTIYAEPIAGGPLLHGSGVVQPYKPSILSSDIWHFGLILGQLQKFLTVI